MFQNGNILLLFEISSHIAKAGLELLMLFPLLPELGVMTVCSYNTSAGKVEAGGSDQTAYVVGSQACHHGLLELNYTTRVSAFRLSPYTFTAWS